MLQLRFTGVNEGDLVPVEAFQHGDYTLGDLGVGRFGSGERRVVVLITDHDF